MNQLAPQPVWFLDTASMLSMACHTSVDAQIRIAIGAHPVRVVQAVVDELAFRATQPETASLATVAQTWLAPLPAEWAIVDQGDVVAASDVDDIQDEIADGRPLLNEWQHYAESVIIALARQAHARHLRTGGQSLDITVLTDDFRARQVADACANATAVSIARVLWRQVQATTLAATDAEATFKHIVDAGRGHEITAADFANPRLKGLGRPGQP